jgi:galactose mutarotase-like enzyme
MKYFLQNDFLKLTIQSKGAELSSIVNKKNDKEYLWQADPKYWNRHAPVLFPIVGKLKKETYNFEHKDYQMSQHGFARDLDFKLVNDSKELLTFRLEESEETLKKYPFRFRFDITYELKGSAVEVSYQINGNNNKEIYFSVGAHPAFLCPIHKAETFEDYYLEFSELETADRHLLTDSLFNGKTETVLNNAKRLPLSYPLFENDAIVFSDLKSNEISLKSTKSENGVKVSFEGFPYMGIWTKEPCAPFLCIEPWCGLADNQNASGLLSEKEGIVKLSPHEVFRRHYQIEIF